MRIAIIGCMVLNREINYLAATSRNMIRIWWQRQGLHDTPDILRVELQKNIDAIERENKLLHPSLKFEAIVLAYGLCSNGVIGLRSRTLPVIVPRCDDCVSLFLGSADRYRELFHRFPGVYWYNRGWIEQAFTPSKDNYRMQREQYAEEYGEENADYLMECTNTWMKNYQYCGYITCPLGECPEYESYARQAAEDFHWKFEKVEGDLCYLDAMVNGPWDDKRFLICPPNSRIEADYSNKKFRSVPCEINDWEEK